MAHTVWVGFGPLFIALEQGFFAREGIEVELIRIEDHTTTYAGLSSGQIDAVAAALQDAPAFFDPADAPLVCVLMLGESRGADGILARRDIRTVADLAGRSVAVLHGSVTHFFLSVLLREAGLGLADLQVVDLSAEDAPAPETPRSPSTKPTPTKRPRSWPGTWAAGWRTRRYSRDPEGGAPL